MERASLDGAFFHYKIDFYYLSGTMQDALLFVPIDGEPILFVKREITRARRESPLEQLISYKSSKEILPHIKPMKRVGMQLDVIPYNDVVRFKELIGGGEFIDVSPLVKELRRVKSPFEINLMKKAAAISKKVYKKVPELLREGMSEIELAGLMEAYAKPLGHEGLLRSRSLNWEAYTWHILSGRAGSIVSQSDSPMGGLGLSPAFPVGASLKKIRKNEPILIDFGICYHGYQVDETRMFAIGSMPDLFVKAYEVCREIQHRILDKALEGGNGNRLVDLAAVASILAAMVADTAADAGERVVFLDDPDRVVVAPFANQGDIPLGALVRRAGVPAGSDAPLFNGKGVGHPLRVELVGSVTLVQVGVKGVREGDGANAGTLTAAGALGNVDVARPHAHGGRKVPGPPIQLEQVGVGNDVDIQVPAGLDQLGRNNAHGAVVGGEGLVELGHVAADGRLFFQQVDVQARLGQIERGLNSGYSSADDQHRTDLFSGRGTNPWLCHCCYPPR